MADFYQVLLVLLTLNVGTNICTAASETVIPNEEKEDLTGIESRGDGKLEIIKKIKKINSDGSYTIGYEADDGSFKIESRDVLGHIKGTYGFVDETGQIKRVSYTSSNTTEVVTTQESPTVVQRIPSRNRTTTKRPPFFSTSFSSTQVTSSTTPNSVVQNIARRRTSTVGTTTTDAVRSDQFETTTPHKVTSVTYTSAPPRVLVQGRHPHLNANVHRPKSEGQILRPEIVSVQPTNSQYGNNLHSKKFDVEKPTTEENEPEVRGNILRRQLPSQPKNQNYDFKDRLPQTFEYDNSDVYTNSMSTAHPKPPLFTTTTRPGRPILSTTPFPLSVSRPVVQYPENYQSQSPQDFDQQQQRYSQEPTTSNSFQPQSTPTAIPVVQIPASKAEESGQYIAFRHPSQRDAILVPLSQVQGKLIPIDQVHSPYEDQRQYVYPSPPQNVRVTEIEQQRAIVRRLPSPQSNQTPKENQYEKNVPQHAPVPYPYPVHGNPVHGNPVHGNPVHGHRVQVRPVPVNVAPSHPVQEKEPVEGFTLEPSAKYIEMDLDNDIDHIQPPVSTRDFQKLLQQLILRQSRLEKVSMLTKQPTLIAYQPTLGRSPFHQLPPNFHQKVEEHNYVQDPRLQIQRPQQRNIAPEHYQQQKIRFQPQNLYVEQYDQQAYIPNRRVARLQPSFGNQHLEEEEGNGEYLPPDVREMLLLRMLQLAINPALPVDESDIEIVKPPVKKKPVRNVEILGEENDTKERVKRERNSHG